MYPRNEAKAANTVCGLARERLVRWFRGGRIAAVAALLSGLPATAVETNSHLATLLQFANGKIPISEAIVYRELSNTNGAVLNQEWWQTGYQGETWYVMRLKPDTNATSGFVLAPPRQMIYGASYTHLWTVSDENIHVAEKQHAADSFLDKAGISHKDLLSQTLELGLPIEAEALVSIAETDPVINISFLSNIETNSSNWKASVHTDAMGRANVIRSPPDLKIPPRFLIGYEYSDSTSSIPQTIKFQSGAHLFVWQFLSLKIGQTDLKASGGYVPKSFITDLHKARSVNLWTNDQSHFLAASGDFLPGFESDKQTRTTFGTLIILSVAFTAVIISVLVWKKRKETKPQPNNT